MPRGDVPCCLMWVVVLNRSANGGRSKCPSAEVNAKPALEQSSSEEGRWGQAGHVTRRRHDPFVDAPSHKNNVQG